MTDKQGHFIAIEGGDGSGKATQVAALVSRMRGEGYVVSEEAFPQYDTSYFGEKLAEFLRGDYDDDGYGTFFDNHPFLAALPYALDRYEAKPRIEEALNRGDVVVTDRFYASNWGHGSAKFNDSDAASRYLEAIQHTEIEVLKIPQPELNIFLYVPHEVSSHLVEKKVSRKHLNGMAKDVAEADYEHQRRTIEVYRQLAQKRDDFVLIECCNETGELKSIDEIHELIWNQVVIRLEP